MPAPRSAPVVGARTTGQAAALESKLLKAYAAHLKAASQETMEAVALYVYGPLLTRATRTCPAIPLPPKRAAQVLADRVELLDEVVPELVMLLQPDEQRRLAPLLLERRNFGGFARAVVGINSCGNSLYRRESDPNLLLDDSYLAKAAGLGKLTRQEYQKPHDPANPSPRWLRERAKEAIHCLPVRPLSTEPLVLTPWPPKPAPKLRTKQKPRRRVPLLLRGQLSLFSAGAGYAAVL